MFPFRQPLYFGGIQHHRWMHFIKHVENNLSQKYTELLAEVLCLKEDLTFSSKTASVALLKSIYTGTSKVKIHNQVAQHQEIMKLLKLAGVGCSFYETSSPLRRLDINFGPQVDGKELYAIVSFLKSYGLSKIYYGLRSKNEITIGTFAVDGEIHELFYTGLDINDYLSDKIYESSTDLIKVHFTPEAIRRRVTPRYELFEAKKLNQKTTTQTNNDDYNDEGYDYGRDNFNALTGGQFGDYDDFNGDWDSLNESIGR